MTTYPSAPVDQPTADALDLLNFDPTHRTDRQIILDVIETIATRTGGRIDPNELRRELYGLVYPKTIGATIHGLTKAGHLQPHGWTVTEGSATGNNGKPCRVYRVRSLPEDSRSSSCEPAAGRRGAVSTRPPLAT